jgi:signal transduction histidine kinase/CheY-like chemotaxis protein
MNNQNDHFGEKYYNPNCVVSNGARVKPFKRCNNCKIKVKNCLGMRMNLVTFYIIMTFVISLKINNFYILIPLETIATLLLIYMAKYTNHETDRLVENSRVLSDLHAQLIARAKEKEALFSLIGHELRTPLASILGHADQMKIHATKENDKNIEKILDQGNHLLKAITNIVDISSLDSISKIDLEKLHISSFKDYLYKNLDFNLAKRKSLDFQINVSNDFPATVLTDKAKIYDILKKLSSNALKFTNKGKVQICLNFIKAEEKIELIITDTGVGIASDELDSIFTPFNNLHNVVTRNCGGMGIDLYICKKLIDSLKGTIEVKSQLGEGTTFKIMFACEVAQNLENSNTNEQTQRHYKTKASRSNEGRILIVEDTEDIQEILEFYISDILSEDLYRIDFANNGKDGLEMANNKDYDLIFMDLHMPIMGGLEASQKIRENGFEGPIVAFTADARVNIKSICLEHGMDDLLHKPLQKEKLIKTLELYYPPYSEKVAS